MQPWQITIVRAQATLTVWNRHAPGLQIGGLGAADLEAQIDGFEALAQACATAHQGASAAHHAVKSCLRTMQVLGAWVPQIIEGHLSDDAGMRRALREVYRVKQTGQNKILERAQRLHPVWVRADAALAALSPPQPPITRVVGEVAHSAAMYRALLQGFPALMHALSDAMRLDADARAALNAHEAACDSLCKRWHRVARASFEPGTPAHKALKRIPTEPDTPRPGAIEIDALTLEGEGGRLVRVSYAAGGGGHATKRLVRWQVAGVDAGYDHSAPLEADGNTLGPFEPGQVVGVMTEVSNSSGSRTGAVRTIAIGAAAG